MYIFKLFLLVEITLYTVRMHPVVAHLDTSVHEISTQVNTCSNFDLIVSETIDTELKCTFIVNYPDVATVVNKTVYFLRNITQQQSASITVCGHGRGRCLVDFIIEPIIVRNLAFVQVSVYAYEYLHLVSQICGWSYFLLWSASFYPQVYVNYIRQSVAGFNFDFAVLHIVGFVYYAVFNCALYWIEYVQEQYYFRYPRSVNPIQLNDVVFSLHAFVLSIVLGVQCIIYQDGDQVVSGIVKILMLLFTLSLILCINLVLAKYIKFLDLLYMCSHIKLITTLVKYTPQIYMNYQRKSTVGYSMGQAMFDFAGGVFSIFQMFVISYNYDDWISLLGAFTKFSIGLISIMFDIAIFVQHYILYPDSNKK